MMISTSIPRKTRTEQSGSLEVRLLGCVDFQATKLLQEWLVSEVAKASDHSGVLMLCEHPPCVSKGRTSSIEQIDFMDERELTAQQIPIIHANRAGGTVLHCPGQLAVYLMLPYERLGLSPVGFVTRLNHALGNVVREQHIGVFQSEHNSVESLLVPQGKKQIATINASSRDGISYYGAYLNVAPDLQLMRFVKPTNGYLAHTSIQAERAGLVRMDAVRESVIRQILNSFGYQKSHIHTSHPFLKRTTRKIHAYA